VDVSLLGAATSPDHQHAGAQYAEGRKDRGGLDFRRRARGVVGVSKPAYRCVAATTTIAAAVTLKVIARLLKIRMAPLF
jgi:hypothetical protein